MKRHELNLAAFAAPFSARPTALGAARKVIPLLLVAGLCVDVHEASAQQSGAQAKRQACEADYQAYCSNVRPGGGRIIACLQQNAAKLSPGCQKALAAWSGR